MIVVAGDALVDMVGDASFRYQAFAGGSCFNTAMAMGRQGADVGFASPLSSDALGRMLAETLEKSGVRVLLEEPVSAPTTLAVVSVDDAGQPTYAFYREKTSDRSVTAEALIEALPAGPSLFHIGSLALIGVPDGAFWVEAAVEARRRGAVVSIDPNVRPSLIDDLGDYRRRIDLALAEADLIKVSDEDLEVLQPAKLAREAFDEIVSRHTPMLAVLTLGDGGAVGVTGEGTEVEQAAIMPGDIIDTIGAGDSLQAGLVSGLSESGWLSRDRLASISEDDLQAALYRGALAAGINCTRKGCNPPWREELEAAGLSLDG